MGVTFLPWASLKHDLLPLNVRVYIYLLCSLACALLGITCALATGVLL